MRLSLIHIFALFSDTHLGRYGDARSLRRVAALIGDQQPDLVVFAGDFFDEMCIRDRCG